jgi:hypothetical protein
MIDLDELTHLIMKYVKQGLGYSRANKKAWRELGGK